MFRKSTSLLLEFRSKAAVAFQGSRSSPSFGRRGAAGKMSSSGKGTVSRGFMPTLKFKPPTLNNTTNRSTKPFQLRGAARNTRHSEEEEGEEEEDRWLSGSSSIDDIIEEVNRKGSLNNATTPAGSHAGAGSSATTTTNDATPQLLAVERLVLDTEEDRHIRRGIDRLSLLREITEAGWEREITPAKHRRVQRLLAHVAAERSDKFSSEELQTMISVASAFSLQRECLDIFYARYEMMTTATKDSGFALTDPIVDSAYKIQSLEDLVKLSEIGAREMQLHPNEVMTDINISRILWRVACIAYERELTEKSRNLQKIDFASGQRVSVITKAQVEQAAKSIYSNILKYNLWINGQAGKQGQPSSLQQPADPSSPPRVASYQLRMTPLSSFSSRVASNGTCLLSFDEVWASMKNYVRYNYTVDRGEMLCTRFCRDRRIIYNSLRILTRKLPTGEQRDILFRCLFESCLSGRWGGQGQIYFDEYSAAIKDEQTENAAAAGGGAVKRGSNIEEVRRNTGTLHTYLRLLIAMKDHAKAVEIAKGIFSQDAPSLLGSSGSDVSNDTRNNAADEEAGEGDHSISSSESSLFGAQHTSDDITQTFSSAVSSRGFINPWLLAKLATAAAEVEDHEFLRLLSKALLQFPEQKLVKAPMVFAVLFSFTQASLKEDATAFLEAAIEKDLIKEGTHFHSLFELEAQVAASLARQRSNALPVIEAIIQSLDEKNIRYSTRVFLDALVVFSEQASPNMISLLKKYIEQQSTSRSSDQLRQYSLHNISVATRKTMVGRFLNWLEANSDSLLSPEDRQWAIDFVKPTLATYTDHAMVIEGLEAKNKGETLPVDYVDHKTSCFIRTRFGTVLDMNNNQKTRTRRRRRSGRRNEEQELYLHLPPVEDNNASPDYDDDCLERRQREAGIIGCSDEEAALSFQIAKSHEVANGGDGSVDNERTANINTSGGSVLAGIGNDVGHPAGLRYLPTYAGASALFEKNWRRDMQLVEQLAHRKRKLI